MSHHVALQLVQVLQLVWRLLRVLLLLWLLLQLLLRLRLLLVLLLQSLRLRVKANIVRLSPHQLCLLIIFRQKHILILM